MSEIRFESYYGVADLGDPYLMHHGIKGMKWGVRRFQNRDGSLTAAGEKRYYTSDGALSKKGERAFKRDARKLQRLQDRTDIEKQRANIEKYEKRADVAKKVGLGAGALAVGSKLLDVGLESARPGIVSNFKQKIKQNDANIEAVTSKLNSDAGSLLKSHWSKLDRIDLQPESVSRLNARKMAEKNFDVRYHAMHATADAARVALANNSNLLRTVASGLGTVQKAAQVTSIASAAVAAGAGATYAYNKVQSRLAKKRMTDIGHQQAIKDYNDHLERMRTTYGDKKMSELLKNKK